MPSNHEKENQVRKNKKIKNKQNKVSQMCIDKKIVEMARFHTT